MKYKSGIEVMQGDVVRVCHGNHSVESVILKVIVAGTSDADELSVPNGGVLVEGGDLDLWVSGSLEDDEDVVFVRRKNHED